MNRRAFHPPTGAHRRTVTREEAYAEAEQMRMRKEYHVLDILERDGWFVVYYDFDVDGHIWEGAMYLKLASEATSPTTDSQS